MDNLTVFLAYLLFFLPLLSGIVFFIVKKQQIRSIFQVLLSVIVLSLLYLSTAGSFEVRTQWAFLGKPLWLGISHTPTIIFLVTVLVLWFLLFVVKQEDEEQLSRFDAALLAFSLAFGYTAFFSGQFLMRYISLEIVGLTAALSVLDWTEDHLSLQRFSVVFTFLRLGDLSLLVSILLLMVDTGILDLNIDEMIKAAVNLPAERQIWILVGVLVAGAMKLAVWPFMAWLRCAERRKQSAAYWVPAVLMPSLGLYLLYRFVPIIESQAIYQQSLAAAALGLLIIPLISLRAQRAQSSLFRVISKMMGALLFFYAASGSTSAMNVYALSFIIFRLILVLRDREYIRMSQRAILVSLLIVHVLPVLFLFQEAPILFTGGWALSMGVIVFALRGMGLLSPAKAGRKSPQAGRQAVPLKRSRAESLIGLKNQGGVGLIESPNQIAAWIYFNVEQTLHHQWEGLERLMMRISRFTLDHVEYTLDHQWEGLERLMMGISRFTMDQFEQALDDRWKGLERLMMRISKITLVRVEQKGAERSESLFRGLADHIGEQEKLIRENPFRWDLLWIPVMVVIVLVVLLTM